MRILFFSDRYGYNFMSIKRSIQVELESRGVEVLYRDKADIRHVLELVKTFKPDQVWLVHSSLVLPCNKDLVKPPVVGFGFSDPHYFSPSRLQSYDAYVTAHYGTYDRYKHIMSVLFSPDPYNPQFYRGLGLERSIDATCIGRAMHPQFVNTLERVDFVNKLRKETNIDVHAYGSGWPPHSKNHNPIEGDILLNTINRSKIGLDIQGCLCSISERVFHYCGCGVPVITREGIEVEKVFVKDREILTYNSYDEIQG